MRVVRRLVRHRPLLAALIVAAALAMRALVPGGYMPVLDHGRIVMQVCAGSLATPVPMAGHGSHHDHPPTDVAAGKCAFADLAQPMTGGADPVLLAVALAFALSLALALALGLPPRAPARLRPPLRGPPLRS